MKNLLLACLIFTFASLYAKDRIIVGVAGGTGSGKTTLAEQIQKAFPNQSVLICQDSYYKDLSHLNLEQREKVNFDHPDSLDFALLKQHVLALKYGQSISKPIYNFHSHTREKKIEEVVPKEVIIVEGILLFAVPEIRDLLDIKIFIDTDDDERLLRRIERDISERSRDFISVRNQYLSSVKPMHDTFVEPSKKYADLIVPRGGKNPTALGMILSKIKEEIQDSSTELSVR